MRHRSAEYHTQGEQMTDHPNEQSASRERQEFPIGLVITGILGTILVIFIVSNNHDVPLKFLSWDLTVPMWSIVFLSAFSGAVLALAISAIRRRGKRRQNS